MCYSLGLCYGRQLSGLLKLDRLRSKAIEPMETGSHLLKDLSGRRLLSSRQGLPQAFHPKPGLIRTATELRALDIQVSVDVFKGGGGR